MNFKKNIKLMNYSSDSAFTLVELLGVIIILGVIALITFPIIDKSIKNSKENALKRIIENIEEAAYKYSVENKLGYDSSYNILPLDELKKKGFLNKEIINPVTNEEMSGCVIYNWVESKKQYEFKYDTECKIEEQPPEILMKYDESLINENGWGNTDLEVTITGTGTLKYCLSNVECEPTDIIEVGNSVKIIDDGINYICAIASNSLGTSEKKCLEYKLDKKTPTILTNDSEFELIKNEDKLVSDYFTVEYGISGGNISCNYEYVPSSTLGNVELNCTAIGNNGLKSTKKKNIEIVADELLHPDGIPDKYQALVTFSAVNGIFLNNSSNRYQILVNLCDDNNNLSETGYHILTETEIPSVAANPGYGNGSWDVSPLNQKIYDDIVFAVRFSYIPDIPNLYNL